MENKQKTALIGKEPAKLFARDGYNLILVARGSQVAGPAEVAKDGYEAPMAGEDRVISGFKKTGARAANLVPDSTVARRLYEQQKPAGQK